MSMYLQSNFEKAAIAVIVYLFDLDKEKRGFNLKKDLFEELRINSSNWDKLRNSTRGIPPELHTHIRKVLVNKYDVNPSFLDTNTGVMFLTGKFTANEGETLYGNASANNEMQRLLNENKQLRELVETQKKLIAQLEEKLRNSAKKSAR